ncbi:MAG: hypothetical protein FJX80_01390 [Bacteroidetes bacterium]|nr:hypothetical protein [Bacteroidota bacterium]
MRLLEEIRGKKILLSPLNWGMGHVSRCIALIEKLKYHNSLTIACNQMQRNILKQYHSELDYVELIGYPFNFRQNKSYLQSILVNLPQLRKHIRYDHEQCEIICKKKGIELVISDHRYGFFSTHTDSVFLTHQVQLPLPWQLWFAQRYHHMLLKNFKEIWIVDDLTFKLAGKLSKPLESIPCFPIGLLSRFALQPSPSFKSGHFLILSGPMAYWKHLIDSFRNFYFDGIIGPEEGLSISYDLKIPLYLSSNWRQIDQLLLSSEKIYGYAGYTTIMDIQFLKCEHHLIACPGQFEQKYLSDLLNGRKQKWLPHQ